MPRDLRVTPPVLQPGQFPKVGQITIGYIARNGDILPGVLIRKVEKRSKDGKTVGIWGTRIEPVPDEDGDELMLDRPWEVRISAWTLDIATAMAFYNPCDPDVPGAKPDGDGDADDA